MSGASETAFLPGIRWRNALIAVVLALLFHALLLFPKIPGLLLPAPPATPRIDIQEVNPDKLDQIRKQWKDQERQLLLNKDKSKPSEDEADPNSRYMSDRNLRVEKEQRAHEHVTVPKPGAPGAPPTSPTRPQPKTAPPKPQNKTLPNLGNLGVPMRLTPTPPRQMAQRDARPGPKQQKAGQEGGEQYVKDASLPEGSENLLNAQESIYYSFFSRLYESVGPVWQSKVRASRMGGLQPGDYSTHLDVVFDRQGNLVAINQLESSGITEFDDAAHKAWRALGRFPNPPSGLLNESGEVHTGWTFTVQVSPGFGVQMMPPERTY